MSESTANPGPAWRDWLLPGDAAAVRRMVAATGVFRPDEPPVAGEIVEIARRDGPAAGYSFLFAREEGDGEDEFGGYVCYGPIPCALRRFDVYWIAVDPARQGRGLGGKLLREAATRMAAAGGRRLFLSTSGLARYDPTRRFYERLGGREAARVTDYYDDGDDLVIYTWPLPLAAQV